MAWDPKSEGIAQIDGSDALSFLKSVRFLFKNRLRPENQFHFLTAGLDRTMVVLLDRVLRFLGIVSDPDQKIQFDPEPDFHYAT